MLLQKGATHAKPFSLIPAALFAWTVLSMLAGCTNPTPTPTLTPTPRTPTPSQSSTPAPTRTPTPHPLGSESNPIIFAVVSETSDPKAGTAADEVVLRLKQITAFNIKARVYTTYSALMADLQSGRAHILFLPPVTYLLARQQNLAQVALMTNHFGVYQYGAQFLANVSSKFTLYFDPARNQNTANPATALKQLTGKRPCWVDPQSPSGYIQALGVLNENGIKVNDGAFLMSHSGVVRALYITGICDFGVTFATTGDPRTSSAVTADLTDVMNRVVILWQTDAIIPNLNISLWSGMAPAMREDLIFALQDVAKTEKGRANLTAANAYEILDVKVVNDSFYDAFAASLKNAKIPLESLIGK